MLPAFELKGPQRLHHGMERPAAAAQCEAWQLQQAAINTQKQLHLKMLRMQTLKSICISRWGKSKGRREHARQFVPKRAQSVSLGERAIPCASMSVSATSMWHDWVADGSCWLMFFLPCSLLPFVVVAAVVVCRLLLVVVAVGDGGGCGAVAAAAAAVAAA